MKPETVLDGTGAAAHGGRFASPGTAAVYLSESDAVATNEVTGRKSGWAAPPSSTSTRILALFLQFALPSSECSI
jgi:RES domain-containing protein